MKNAILAVSLIAGSQAAVADGFAPWDNRAVAADAKAGVSVNATTSRFAPWDNRNVSASSADRDAVVVTPVSAFRPWS